MTPRKINPPHYFFGALVLMLLIDFLVVPMCGDDSLLQAPWPWLGVLPLAVGVGLAFAGAGRFSKVGTSIVPLTTSSVLVTDGPFRFSRNPMYLGMILTLIGVGVLMNRAPPWIVVPIFAAILWLRFVRHEEKLMEETFGDDYRAYKTRVRRWL
jgi:protein-S-isoprenylcysteine O-methyltransferase Ste14